MSMRPGGSPRRGMNTQRDRGRRKKHHKSDTHDDSLRERTNDENWEDKLRFFENWLENEFRDERGNVVEPSQSLSLKKFLQGSPTIDIAPDEKLRQLAIHWESKCSEMNQPKGWKILKRVYQEVLKFDSDWSIHYHSASLSARTCSRGLDREDPIKIAMLNESIGFCREGLERNPECDLLWLSLGRTEYELGRTEVALKHFERAIEFNAKANWAALYRAHCLHDLERWAEAANAYECVDISFFDGHLAWRATCLRDQLAECWLKSGESEKALDEFEAALHRYESNPGLLEVPDYLERAAESELASVLAKRINVLLKRDGFFHIES